MPDTAEILAQGAIDLVSRNRGKGSTTSLLTWGNVEKNLTIVFPFSSPYVRGLDELTRARIIKLDTEGSQSKGFKDEKIIFDNLTVVVLAESLLHIKAKLNETRDAVLSLKHIVEMTKECLNTESPSLQMRLNQLEYLLDKFIKETAY